MLRLATKRAEDLLATVVESESKGFVSDRCESLYVFEVVREMQSHHVFRAEVLSRSLQKAQGICRVVASKNLFIMK